MKNTYILLLLLLLALVGSVWLLLSGGAEEAGDLDGADCPASVEGRKAPGHSPEELLTAALGASDPSTRPEEAAGALILTGRVVDERRMPVADVAVALRTAAQVLAKATSHAEGRYRFDPPPDRPRKGTHVALLAQTTDGRRAALRVELARLRAGHEHVLPTLVLTASLDLEVRVVRNGRGVRNARVAVARKDAGTPLPLTTSRSDEDGYARLGALPAGPLTLFATAPGHGRGTLAVRLPLPDGADTPTIELQEERVVSVLVYDADTQRPVAGATLEVGDARTMPPWHGPGYLPALPPLRTDRDGRAVMRGLAATETAYVNARAAGYPFAPWWRSQSQVAAPEQSDIRIVLSAARATTEGLSRTAEVPRTLPADRPEAGDPPDPFQLVLMLLIDGAEQLPSDYTVRAAGRRIDEELIDEDAATGRLACEVAPPPGAKTVRIDLLAPGFLTETLRVDPPGDATQTVELRRAGRLVAHVTPPDKGGFTLQLQRHDPAREAWRTTEIPGDRRSRAPARATKRTHAYGGLAPGRYRVLDLRSRQSSAGAEVGLGAKVDVHLDLSGDQVILGRVVGPVGARLDRARVLVEGRDDELNVWSGVRPRADGSFQVRASRTSPVTLRVTHPSLALAADGGRVTVPPGVAEVELRLEPGAELLFRVAGHEHATTPPSGHWHAPVTLQLVPETPGEGALYAVLPDAEDGVFRAGGFPAGTYTVWVTFEDDQAPYIERGLEIGSAPVDLGTLAPTPGTTLRLRITNLADRPRAFLWAAVHHEDRPSYTREARLDDKTTGELVVGGLGAGHFRVVVRAAGLGAGAASVVLDRVVTADGVRDLTLDLRLP